MSNRYLDAAWKIGGLSATEKIILVRLADRADANGRSFAGRASIGRECCVDRRTVSRAFKRLTALGLLEREPQGAGVKGYGTSVSFLTSKIFDTTSDEPPEKPSSETDTQPDDMPADPTPEPEADGADVIPLPGLELTPEEEPAPTSTISEDFEELWEQSPRRNGMRAKKKDAKEKYVRLMKSGSVTQSELLTAISKYSAYCDSTQTKAADLVTWLNGKRWRDEIEPSETSQQSPPNRMTAAQARDQRTDQAILDTWQKLQANQESAGSASNLIPKGN